MITTRNDLYFYLRADRMMNRGAFTQSLIGRLKNLIMPDYIMMFLRAMRFADYYSHRKWLKILYVMWLRRFRRLSLKCGFAIGYSVFGYGLVIPHNGTIVVGESNRIGNYAVLHTSTCIVNGCSVIGDGLYMSSGAKISKQIRMGDNVTVGCNSVVNKSLNCENVLLVGMPSSIKCQSEPWYVRDGIRFRERFERVEALKREMNV